MNKPAGGPSTAPLTSAAGPFTSLRDYLAALEQHDLLLRIPEFDQEAAKKKEATK